MKKLDFNRKRRLIVSGVVATLASLYAGAVGRGALKSCGIDALDAGLADLRPLIRIGDAYLEELADSGKLSTLHDELPGGRLIRSIRLVGAIQRRVYDEFQRGDTVICDGWVLARSEAQLCAMAAMGVRRLKDTQSKTAQT
jgi:hypothetical protein